MLLKDVSFRFKRFFLGAERVRRTRLYGIGLGKTGTNSLCKMFSKNVRAVHEAQALTLIEKFLEWRNGNITEAQMSEWVRRRDREMALEVDASSMNTLILGILAREFPDARFILTVRDCYSWVNSVFNHTLRVGKKTHPQWELLGAQASGDRDRVHSPEEQVLKDNGLLTLDWYLSRWSRHIDKTLNTVPPERLLIVRTAEIGKRAYEIADFAGLPRWAVRLDRTHSFKNPVRKELILQIDRKYLEQKVEQHCHALMNRFFPEIKSLESARL